SFDAQHRQLVHLLHQPHLPLLECGSSHGVVGDPCQLHLLPRHLCFHLYE
ncbi:unnamed protein product, partial [Musa acuminata subsp. malaccensis]